MNTKIIGGFVVTQYYRAWASLFPRWVYLSAESLWLYAEQGFETYTHVEWIYEK